MALTTATVLIGAASVASGVAGQRKTDKANKSAQKKALSSEAARRERAAEELEKAMSSYNQLRGQRPALTVQQFLQERAELSGNEEQKNAFNKLTREDFSRAQAVADQATLGNINSYEVVLDALSGGKSAEMLSKRNSLALEDDSFQAYQRALQLRSTSIPSGTVRYDNQGRLVEGQRADKQVFQTAYEVDQERRASQFNRLNLILGQDRNIALAQQEKASQFLDQSSFLKYASDLSDKSLAIRGSYQAADEAASLNAINEYRRSAFTDQTQQPTYQTNEAAGKLISSGFDLALSGLSSAAMQPKSSSATARSTSSGSSSYGLYGSSGK